MSAGILDGFQTIIPTAAAVLSEKRQILRLTQQEVADRAKITLRQYQRLESGERSILTCSFGLACRVIEALDMDVSKFYHGDYYLEEEVKTMRGKGIASRKKVIDLKDGMMPRKSNMDKSMLKSLHLPA